MSLVGRVIARWEERAAVRAEHQLELTLRRRVDRLPARWRDRRALRAERHARAHDVGRAIDEASRRARARDYLP
jgi:hypothetical protein